MDRESTPELPAKYQAATDGLQASERFRVLFKFLPTPTGVTRLTRWHGSDRAGAGERGPLARLSDRTVPWTVPVLGLAAGSRDSGI
eukprot:751382-Hanusia_phi.AAC.1